MTDEQSHVISLDAPLDINSNDMLVQAAKPTFAFNRQRFLGSLNQTSVRYEGDGWFAGWWGHTFEQVSTGTNYITPALDDNKQLVAVDRQHPKDTAIKYFDIQTKDTGLKWLFTLSQWECWLTFGTGAKSVERISDSTMRISGTTYPFNEAFIADVNVYDGTVLAFTCTDPGLVSTVTKSGRTWKLTVGYVDAIELNYFTLRKNREVMLVDTTSVYTRDTTTSYWSFNSAPLFTLTDANVFGINDTDWVINSQTPMYVGTDTEHVAVDLTHSAEVKAIVELDSMDKPTQNWFQYPEMTLIVASKPGIGQDAYYNDQMYITASDAPTPVISQLYNSQRFIKNMTWFYEDVDSWTYFYGYRTNHACMYVRTLPIWMYFRSFWTVDYYVTPMPPPIPPPIIPNPFAAIEQIHFTFSYKDLEHNINDCITDNDLIKVYWASKYTNAAGVVTWQWQWEAQPDFAVRAYNKPIQVLTRPPAVPIKHNPNVQPFIANSNWPPQIPNPTPQPMIPNPSPPPAMIPDPSWPAFIYDLDWVPPQPYLPIPMVQNPVARPLIPTPAGTVTIWDISTIPVPTPGTPWASVPAAYDTPEDLFDTNYYQQIADVWTWGPQIYDPINDMMIPNPAWQSDWPTSVPYLASPTQPPLQIVMPSWLPTVLDPLWYWWAIDYDAMPDTIITDKDYVWPDGEEHYEDPDVIDEFDHTIELEAHNRNPEYPWADLALLGVVKIVAHVKVVRHIVIAWKKTLHAAADTHGNPAQYKYVYDPEQSYWAYDEITISLKSSNVKARSNVAIDIDNSTLCRQDGNDIVVTVPRCEDAYALNRIDTLDLEPNIKEYFRLTAIPNEVIGVKWFRFDDGGSTDPTDIGRLNGRTLDIATATINSLVSISADSSALVITYESTLLRLWFSRTNMYDGNGTNSIKTNIWPSFVDGVGMGDLEQYMPSTELSIADKIVFKILKAKWFNNINTSSIDLVTPTTFNTYLRALLFLSASVIKISVRAQHIVLRFVSDNTKYVEFDYDVITKVISNYSSNIAPWSIISRSEIITIRNTIKIETVLTVIYQHAFELWRTILKAKSGIFTPVSIASQAGQTVTMAPVGTGDALLIDEKLVNSTIYKYVYSSATKDTVTYFARILNDAVVEYIPKGIIWRNNDQLVYVNTYETATEYILEFTYDGNTHALHVDKASKAFLACYVTDIRNDEVKEIATMPISNIVTYVKQFWSATTHIEQYWWVDDKHVLVLGKYEMLLYRKVEGKFDDWMGDAWEIVKRTARANFISASEDLYYTMSNSYQRKPVFFKIKVTATLILIYIIEDIINANWVTMTPDNLPGATTWRIFDFNTETIALSDTVGTGDTLYNAVKIRSYAGINAAALVTTTTSISHTVIGTTLLIGLAASRGLKQWTLKMSVSGTMRQNILVGYGHVGIKGQLTGGILPSRCCDANGFKEIVHDIKVLPVEGAVPNICVGTKMAVWFVYSEIPTIVACYETVDGWSHTKQELHLNNNVVQKYISFSVAAAYLFDMIPIAMGLQDFLPIDTVSNVLALVAAVAIPSLWTVQAGYGFLLYINHATCNYSYVWKTATQEQVKSDEGKPKVDKDIQFCKIKHAISFTPVGDSGLIKWVTLILKGISGLNTIATDYIVNKATQQTQTDDSTGKALTALATEITAETVSTVVQADGMGPSVSSTLYEQWSLAQFYMISDKTQVFAGPGFTEINLIGMAPVQSFTDQQIVGRNIGYFAPLLKLSQAVVNLQLLAYEFLRESALKSADWLAPLVIPTYAAGSGTAIPVGQVAAAVLLLTAKAFEGLIAAAKTIRDYVLPALTDFLGGEQGQAYQKAGISDFKLELEGLHYYGQRPMTFMWPVFGITNQLMYTDEKIAWIKKTTIKAINMGGNQLATRLMYISKSTPDETDNEFAGKEAIQVYVAMSAEGSPSQALRGKFTGGYFQCKGEHTQVAALPDMNVIEGCTSFLSDVAFKNMQIGLAEPVFAPPKLHDYMIDTPDGWNLSLCAGAGQVVWIAQGDTKLIDGAPSNIVMTDAFCGIASSYTVIEVKKDFDKRYLRPWAITPNAIALNINGINCVHDAKAYHAFDGYSNRIINWVGASGMDRCNLWQQYMFQVNDHFKRSNILPPSQYFGAFSGPPVLAVAPTGAFDKQVNLMQSLATQQGIENDIPGEQKNLQRFALAVHSETISTLPAMVRMLAPYKLHVVEGITSLCTDIRSTQTAYKAPSSIDFNINGTPFRATDEFICALDVQKGIVGVTDKVAIAGLQFVGATTRAAYFYSPATRMYYEFGGSTDITTKDIFNRFKDIIDGRWDFVNQEVVFKALSTGSIIDNKTFILRLDGNVRGEVYPPPETIYNERSGFKMLSMAGGLVFQGPKRFTVQRFITNDHMFTGINANKRKWTRLSRDVWSPDRDYGWHYEDIETDTPIDAVNGWTHNPYRLATSMLGSDEETDSKFEWKITFAWTEQMDALFAQNEYVTVDVCAETVTPGGTLLSAPTHIFLFKECFTRAGCAGYYTFVFQSNNGIGNRERLYIWSDGIIAIEDLQLTMKNMTQRRNIPLHIQVDVQDLQEL